MKKQQKIYIEVVRRGKQYKRSRKIVMYSRFKHVSRWRKRLLLNFLTVMSYSGFRNNKRFSQDIYWDTVYWWDIGVPVLTYGSIPVGKEKFHQVFETK